MKKILLLESNKEQGELFASWLREKNYEVEVMFTPEEAGGAVSKDGFDLFIMDIDAPEIVDKCLNLCRALKEDPRTQEIPVSILTYKKDAEKIAGAIESGADNFMLKPFETESFLERITIIFREIELKKQGKKVLDLNYINYLMGLTGELERGSFFRLAEVIFNKLIIEKINTILGGPVIAQIIKRCNEMVGEDYAFMKEVKFSGALIAMDGADKASGKAPAKKLVIAFRDYIYAFLQLVRTLTSDILMERGVNREA